MPKGIYVCPTCKHDCYSLFGLSGHIASKHPGTSVPSKESFEHLLKTSKTSKESKEEKPKTSKEETSKASDVSKSPFLAARIEFAKVVEALKEKASNKPPPQPNTGEESPKEPVKEAVEEPLRESKESRDVKDVVETQKKQLHRERTYVRNNSQEGFVYAKGKGTESAPCV